MTDSPQVTGGMEERYREMNSTTIGYTDGDGIFVTDMDAINKRYLDFIRQEISLALTHDRARLVEEVENMMKETNWRELNDAKGAQKFTEANSNTIYNEALDDVLTLLKDKGV